MLPAELKCIRLNSLLIQGVTTVAAEAIGVIRFEWCQ